MNRQGVYSYNPSTDEILFRLKPVCKCNREVVQILNEQKEEIYEKDKLIDKQREIIRLIADACAYTKQHSVKEILRNEIRGIDTVTYESANAWHDYVILSEFFEEHYKEHWDNE